MQEERYPRSGEADSVSLQRDAENLQPHDPYSQKKVNTSSWLVNTNHHWTMFALLESKF